MKLELNYHQSGVVPFRKKGKKKIEIFLITSVKKQRWIIPKGYVEFNLSAFESAKKEAIEEAGVLGSNETFELRRIYHPEILWEMFHENIFDGSNKRI